ncbi:MAG: hypothetical protein AAFX99_35045, partial [Myxococcota bacterium]
SLSIASASHPWVLFALWFALVTVGCQGELKPEEPDGAYLLFRQALLDQDTDTIYSFLNNKTKTVFDTRTVVLKDMSTKIDRFLPQVDQKLARSQTGVVLLKKHDIKDGKALFKHLFQSKAIEVTEGLQVGSGIRFPGGVEYLDEDKTQAVIVTWANDQYYLVLEEEGEDKKIWRVASWLEDAEAKTQWIVTNQKNLDQTIQDLISEEKEEIDTVIKYLLAQEQKRASRGDRN